MVREDAGAGYAHRRALPFMPSRSTRWLRQYVNIFHFTPFALPLSPFIALKANTHAAFRVSFLRNSYTDRIYFKCREDSFATACTRSTSDHPILDSSSLAPRERMTPIHPLKNDLTLYGASAIFLKCPTPRSNPFHGSVQAIRTSGHFQTPCRTRWATRCIRPRLAKSMAARSRLQG